MLVERRHAARNRVFQGAKIVFNGEQSMFDCSMRNRSSFGAMVRLADWVALPSTFEVDLDQGGERVRVRQRWRRGDDVGVAFCSVADNQPPAPIDLGARRLLSKRPWQV